MRFLKEIWDDITGKMLPWFKWSFGIVAYVLVLVSIPICFIVFLPLILIVILIQKMPKINIKKFFFKEDK